MSAPATWGAVLDNSARNRYELQVDGEVAFINYRRVGDVVTMTHAEVPVRFEGKGVGSALARGALDRVRASGERVVPACPFISVYIERHGEYRDLVVAP